MTGHFKKLFINFSDRGGGAEQFTFDLYAQTPHAEMMVARKYTDARVRTLPENISTKLLRPVNRFIQRISRYRSLQHFLGLHDQFHDTYRRLADTAAYQSAQLVHLNNIHGGWFDLKAIYSIDRDKPVIWTLHDMWCMTGGEAYTFDHKGYEIGNWNTPFIKHYPLNQPFFDYRKNALLTKKSLYPQLQQTVFVPVSDWLANCLRKSAVYHDDMKIRTIKNGVHTDTFHPVGRATPNGKRKVLFFNSDSPFKAASIGLELLKGIEHDAEIYIVGPQPQLDLKHHYIGNRIDDRNELAELYREMDILLFPSLAENMPLTVLEAMGCGVVVVAFPTGGIPEVIIDGETGFLSSDLSPGSLQHQLRKALNTDLEKISGNAVDWVRLHHDFRIMQRKYEDLYAEMLET